MKDPTVGVPISHFPEDLRILDKYFQTLIEPLWTPLDVPNSCLTWHRRSFLSNFKIGVMYSYTGINLILKMSSLSQFYSSNPTRY